MCFSLISDQPAPLEQRFRASQIFIILNFVVVSSVGIKSWLFIVLATHCMSYADVYGLLC